MSNITKSSLTVKAVECYTILARFALARNIMGVVQRVCAREYEIFSDERRLALDCRLPNSGERPLSRSWVTQSNARKVS